MSDKNQVFLEGTIAFDPDAVRFVGAKGTAVLNFKMHTTEGVKGKEFKETHKITAWGSMAEEIGQASKGDRLIVEGRLQTRSWDDKKHPGVKQYSTDIIASKITLSAADPRSGGNSRGQPSPDDFGPPDTRPPQGPENGNGPDEDSIPF